MKLNQEILRKNSGEKEKVKITMKLNQEILRKNSGEKEK